MIVPETGLHAIDGHDPLERSHLRLRAPGGPGKGERRDQHAGLGILHQGHVLG